jgi:hypothetical protein
VNLTLEKKWRNQCWKLLHRLCTWPMYYTMLTPLFTTKLIFFFLMVTGLWKDAQSLIMRGIANQNNEISHSCWYDYHQKRLFHVFCILWPTSSHSSITSLARIPDPCNYVLLCASKRSTILDSAHKWEHQYFSFCVWFISLNMVFSGFIQVAANSTISFFLNDWLVFHSVHL